MASSRNTFASFLDIAKTVILQVQSLFDEGPLSDHAESSLGALENLSMRMGEICETFRVILISMCPDDEMSQKICELLTVLNLIKDDVNYEAENLTAQRTNVHSQPQVKIEVDLAMKSQTIM